MFSIIKKFQRYACSYSKEGGLCSLKEFQWSTTQKMKFSIKDFFSKCDQIRSFLILPNTVSAIVLVLCNEGIFKVIVFAGCYGKMIKTRWMVAKSMMFFYGRIIIPFNSQNHLWQNHYPLPVRTESPRCSHISTLKWCLVLPS